MTNAKTYRVNFFWHDLGPLRRIERKVNIIKYKAKTLSCVSSGQTFQFLERSDCSRAINLDVRDRKHEELSEIKHERQYNHPDCS